jgi:hypothetical protein
VGHVLVVVELDPLRVDQQRRIAVCGARDREVASLHDALRDAVEGTGRPALVEGVELLRDGKPYALTGWDHFREETT